MPSQDENAEGITLNFGEMEARLSILHEIASEKRTQFQARLRNFQRLGIPANVSTGRGKSVHYSPGQVVEMALALELTQLGLLPERVVQVFQLNKFPIAQGVAMAARAIMEKGGFLPDRERVDQNMTVATGSQWVTHDEEDDPMSMFLFFDPTALASLTDIPEKYEDQASATFFYGGPGIVRENIVRWTAGPHTRRLSLINVTALLWSLIVRTKPERQQQFCKEVETWADELQREHLTETVEGAVEEDMLVLDSPEKIIEHAETLKGLKGLPKPVAEALVERVRRIVETGEVPGPGAGLTGKPIANMSGPEFVEEMIGRLTMSGLPEFLARGAVEASTRNKAKQEKQVTPKKRRRKDGDR
ncbi:hypothetical protein [Sphingomonas hankyongi]|uniref:HTH merR-type domain-containing protein n=1 Tax=Sphingomonas hankyongi TaxID=2908209 RepID=A0ABT0S277_9SPHN|nr:hypothetical protein [Sphingomonas hankyongi]MCL6729882.1 hypothetical protein [Sphingomonas hankyongi]